MKQKIFNRTLVSLFSAALFFGACADDNFINKNQGANGDAALSFDIDGIQESIPEQTRVATLGLNEDDLAPQRLEASNNAGMDIFLVETTIPGVNPVQPDELTRGRVVKNNLPTDFSTLGYRGDQASTISQTPNWFYNKRTKRDGQLYEQLFWNWTDRFARFYAIYPEVNTTNSNIKLSDANHAGQPQIEFTVKPNVPDQQDLMTATTGIVEYATRHEAPSTTLKFHHALTAVHFTVGANLWAGRIQRIEIRGAINKGTYTLSDNPSQPGTWTLGTSTDNFVLSYININTVVAPNSVITDDQGNYTFFMIPQEVTGKGISVYVKFQDGKEINVPLKGKWLQGTTKTYTLTNTTSNWEYKLEVVNPAAAIAYNYTQSGNYQIRSYRSSPGGYVALPWKVVGYQESIDGGNTWSAESETAPAWLTSLSKTEGVGGWSAEQGNAQVTKNLIDKLTPYNQVMKNSPEKGSDAHPYNLSNSNGNDPIENTANCYLVSAPGYYRLPLVYGNAIKWGGVNTSAYISSAPATMVSKSKWQKVDGILHHFKDHNDQNINNPYINVQNAGNPVTQASIVWADQKDIVRELRVENGFIRFRVTKDDIRNGNAVIAAKNSAGTIMWSWHIWFDHADALNRIPITNNSGIVYNLPTRPIGFAYAKWDASLYDKPRQVRVKVRQLLKVNGVNQEAFVIITQNPGSDKDFHMTSYQFGRKDAFLRDHRLIKEGSLKNTLVNNASIGYSIQNPDQRISSLLVSGNNVESTYNAIYINLWSTNRTDGAYNDNPVVKTVYDPSPVGFNLPPTAAFSGFTQGGASINLPSEKSKLNSENTDYHVEQGYKFWTNSTRTNTVYFPMSVYYMGYWTSGIALYHKTYYNEFIPDGAQALTITGSSISHYMYGIHLSGLNSVFPTAE